jgi:hypothetical protein
VGNNRDRRRLSVAIYDPRLINSQPLPQNSPSELLKASHRRGIYSNINSLINIIDGQERLPFKHFCDQVEWPCEKGVDQKVAKGKKVLQKIFNDIVGQDGLGESDSFSLLCQRYILSKNNVESEKKVIWLGESLGIGCVVAGSLYLLLFQGLRRPLELVQFFLEGSRLELHRITKEMRPVFKV